MIVFYRVKANQLMLFIMKLILYFELGCLYFDIGFISAYQFINTHGHIPNYSKSISIRFYSFI